MVTYKCDICEKEIDMGLSREVPQSLKLKLVDNDVQSTILGYDHLCNDCRECGFAKAGRYAHVIDVELKNERYKGEIQ